MSNKVTLAAGTLVEQLGTDGIWRYVPGLTSTGQTGTESEAKDSTDLGDTIKKYDDGMPDGGDSNFKGQVIPTQTEGDQYYEEQLLQEHFFARCRNREQMPLRVTWPSLMRAQKVFKPLGFITEDVAATDWLGFSVAGKNNSDTTWGTAPELTAVDVTGNDTVASGENQQLSAVNTPLDAYYVPRDDVYTSSDDAIATVTPWGYVTAVAAGSVTISLDRGGVVSTLDITVS